MSNVVKLMPTAMGPLTQFIVTPLNSDAAPSDCTIARAVAAIEVKRLGACFESATPTAPSVCIRLRTVSSGYVSVCATRPDAAPHASLWGIERIFLASRDSAVGRRALQRAT